MKIGEYDVLIIAPHGEQELCAEVRQDNRELAKVSIRDGQPAIAISPNHDGQEAWTIEYRTFRQIVQALDDFLFSAGYPVEVDGQEP